jgi:26S proteasome regulatory subunit N7
MSTSLSCRKRSLVQYSKPVSSMRRTGTEASHNSLMYSLSVDLAPMYKYVCTALNIPMDAEKYAAMKAKNEVKLDELDKKLKDAEENLGETEVRDALHAKADYLCELSDKEAAIKAYQLTEEKTAGAGNKVDLIFSQIR